MQDMIPSNSWISNRKIKIISIRVKSNRMPVMLIINFIKNSNHLFTKFLITLVKVEYDN